MLGVIRSYFQPYCLSVDTYAFGIICWEMLTREKVFGVEVYMSEVESKIIRGTLSVDFL